MILTYSFYVLLLIFLTNGDSSETVKELDLEKYTGRWFQVFSNNYVSQTLQLNSMCITVDYSIRSNTSLFATTHSRLYNPMGSEMTVKGQIICPDKNIPGNMQLSVEGAKYPTPYMVILLGPVNNSTQHYEYAVVTDTNNVSLYIYARDIHVFRKEYQHHVLNFCHNHGFSSYYNEPKETPQPAACEYVEKFAKNEEWREERFRPNEDEMRVVVT